MNAAPDSSITTAVAIYIVLLKVIIFGLILYISRLKKQHKAFKQHAINKTIQIEAMTASLESMQAEVEAMHN